VHCTPFDWSLPPMLAHLLFCRGSGVGGSGLFLFVSSTDEHGLKDRSGPGAPGLRIVGWGLPHQLSFPRRRESRCRTSPARKFSPKSQNSPLISLRSLHIMLINVRSNGNFLYIKKHSVFPVLYRLYNHW